MLHCGLPPFLSQIFKRGYTLVHLLPQYTWMSRNVPNLSKSIRICQNILKPGCVDSWLHRGLEKKAKRVVVHTSRSRDAQLGYGKPMGPIAVYRSLSQSFPVWHSKSSGFGWFWNVLEHCSSQANLNPSKSIGVFSCDFQPFSLSALSWSHFCKIQTDSSIFEPFWTQSQEAECMHRTWHYGTGTKLRWTISRNS